MKRTLVAGIFALLFIPANAQIYFGSTPSGAAGVGAVWSPNTWNIGPHADATGDTAPPTTIIWKFPYVLSGGSTANVNATNIQVAFPRGTGTGTGSTVELRTGNTGTVSGTGANGGTLAVRWTPDANTMLASLSVGEAPIVGVAATIKKPNAATIVGLDVTNSGYNAEVDFYTAAGSAQYTNPAFIRSEPSAANLVFGTNGTAAIRIEATQLIYFPTITTGTGKNMLCIDGTTKAVYMGTTTTC
jgi:hypothetical protein